MPVNLIESFPFGHYSSIRPPQIAALRGMEGVKGVIVRELPVGTGKTALGITYLDALRKDGKTRLFYIAPNKAQVDQVKSLHPEVRVAYGRNEHDCLYYDNETLRADEVPCSMLVDCPHRVDQLTGETHEEGAVPCPYLQQKFEAKQMEGIVVCTHAFYLFTVLFSQEFAPEALVVDEVHKLARSIRSVLSTDITDWKLARAIEVLDEVSSRQCEKLSQFLADMKRLVKRNAMDKEVLLEEEQIKRLYDALLRVSPSQLQQDIRKAVTSGKLDKREDREVLKQVEDIVRSVRRFQHALKFAMSDMTKMGYPLNFVIAFGKTEMGPRDKVQYKITVKDYYVVPIIKKLLPEDVFAYSATIGDPDYLSFETGIKGNFESLPSDFPIENARIYMPTDTLNLTVKSMGASKRPKAKMIRLMTRSAKRFANRGIRSLVIVASNEERLKFMMMAGEEGLDAITYGDDMPARECALRFRNGQSDCMVGTSAHFGEGIDLPKQTAPVIFYLRPGYASPDDPQTQFEERRFGNRRWQLWNWRVMTELLQVRGRNVRSAEDLGVTFLISQHFRRFAWGSLPPWLQPAYKGDKLFEECMKDAFKLLA